MNKEEMESLARKAKRLAVAVEDMITDLKNMHLIVEDDSEPRLIPDTGLYYIHMDIKKGDLDETVMAQVLNKICEFMNKGAEDPRGTDNSTDFWRVKKTFPFKAGFKRLMNNLPEKVKVSGFIIMNNKEHSFSFSGKLP
jgi:hypothetical protein